MGQNYNKRMNKKSFEEVPQFKNLGKKYQARNTAFAQNLSAD